MVGTEVDITRNVPADGSTPTPNYLRKAVCTQKKLIPL